MGEDNKKRENIILFVVSVLLTSICYITFLKGYYSIDTPKILKLGYNGYGYYYSLYDGRFLMALIGQIASIIQINIKQYYIILLVCSILISSISVIKIYSIITKIKPTKRKIIKLLLFIASYSYIFNFMSIDNFKWVECIIMSISILFYILAAEKIIIQEKKIVGLIYALIGIFCYQGTINMFIATSILFIFIQTSKLNKKYVIKKLTYLVISSIIIVGIDFIIIKIIQNSIDSIQPNRISFTIISNLIGNIKLLPNLVFGSLQQYPKFLHISFIIIFLILGYANAIKNNDIKTFFLGVFIIGVYYISCLLLGLVYPEVIWMYNGRVFGAVGSVISAYILFLYINSTIFESEIYKQIGITISIVYFITIIINTNYMTLLLKSDNNIDEEFAKQIVSQVEEYEHSNDKKIKKIAINYIIDQNAQRKRIRQSWKKLAVYDSTHIKLYTNRDIENVIFEEEIKEKYFNNQEEKMLCIDDTIYVQTII